MRDISYMRHMGKAKKIYIIIKHIIKYVNIWLFYKFYWQKKTLFSLYFLISLFSLIITFFNLYYLFEFLISDIRINNVVKYSYLRLITQLIIIRR